MHRPSRCRYLSICLSVCLSIYLSTYLSTYPPGWVRSGASYVSVSALPGANAKTRKVAARIQWQNPKSIEKCWKVENWQLATVLESKSTHFSRKVDHCHGILGWCISEPLHAINWHTVQQINSFHLDCGRIFWNPPKGRNLKGYMAVPKVVTISNLKVLQRSWAKQTNQTVMAVESWTLSSLYYILWSPTDF